MVIEAPTFSIDEKADPLEEKFLAIQDNPEEFMNGIVAELNDPQNSLIKRNKLAKIFWHAASTNPQYFDEIETRLVADKDHIAQTGYVLDLIRESRDFFHYFSPANNQEGSLEAMVKSFAVRCREQDTGSYFLVKKAEILSAEMDGTLRRRSMDKGMFQISPTHWAAYNLDGLAISTDSSYLAEHRQGIAFDTEALSSLGNREVSAGDLADFSYLQSKLMRNEFTKEFHIELSRLHLPEQFQMLMFLKSKTAAEVEPVKGFAKKFGTTGMRTFLSLEYGKEFGDKIVEMSERLPVDIVKKIFEKFSELIDGSEEIDAMTPDIPGKEKLAEEAKNNLLKRARKMLSDFLSEETLSSDYADFIQSLSSVTRSNQILVSVSKALTLANPEHTLKLLKDIQFGEELAGNLEWDDIYSLKELYTINYARTPLFKERLLKSFEEIISNPKQSIEIMRHRGVIIGFYLYTPNEDGSLDFRCFNLHPSYADGGLGSAMMQAELNDRAEKNTVHATCTVESPIAPSYIESGFVGFSVEKVDEINSMAIIRNDKRRDLFISKSMSTEEITAKLAGENDYKDDTMIIKRVKQVDDTVLVAVGMNSEEDSTIVLTRFIKVKPDNILVFEKVSPNIITQFKAA